MTCVKTGCHIWIAPYQEFAYGDAFALEAVLPTAPKHTWRKLREQGLDEHIRDIYLFRLVARSFQPINGRASVDFIIHNYDQWFDKDSRMSTLFSNHVTKAETIIEDLSNV